MEESEVSLEGAGYYSSCAAQSLYWSWGAGRQPLTVPTPGTTRGDTPLPFSGLLEPLSNQEALKASEKTLCLVCKHKELLKR